MAARYRDLAGFYKRPRIPRRTQAHFRTRWTPYLEMTEIADRTLRARGPALLFENPRRLFDTRCLPTCSAPSSAWRWAWAPMTSSALREIGELLAYLRQPDPPKGLRDAWEKAPLLRKVLDMGPKLVRNPPCRTHLREGDDVDLYQLPDTDLLAGDAGPLVTWPLVITRGPEQAAPEPGHLPHAADRRNKLIMRWLAHRGGALDYRDWQLQHPGERYPVSHGAGCRPGHHPRRRHPGAGYAVGVCLRRPAARRQDRGDECITPAVQPMICRYRPAEFMLEGHIHPDDMADPRVPSAITPVITTRSTASRCSRSTASPPRGNPIYHSTYTGRPPDEPAILGVALNEVFVPLLQKQFPEIVDFYLPPEGCSYRMAVVSMKQGIPRARQAGDARDLELPAPVHVHQVRRRHR
jgi:4-hydroxy-3-polyprenylbenzoate decarboxylase